MGLATRFFVVKINFAKIVKVCYNDLGYADVAELADAPDLGSGSERGEGSSPFIRIFGSF